MDAVRRRRRTCTSHRRVAVRRSGAAANCAAQRAADAMTEMFSGGSLRWSASNVKGVAGLRGTKAPARAVLTNCNIHTRQHHPAAEAISGKGRPQRRSAKNRRTFSIRRGQSRTRPSCAEARKRLRKRTFDCFKSAAGIRFSAVARTTPKSFHRGGFSRHLLTSKGGIIG